MTVSLRPLEDISSFRIDDQSEVPYWVDQTLWVKGVANHDFAPGRGEEIDETILRLDWGRNRTAPHTCDSRRRSSKG
jgi:hypothetical protein